MPVTVQLVSLDHIKIKIDLSTLLHCYDLIQISINFTAVILRSCGCLRQHGTIKQQADEGSRD